MDGSEKVDFGLGSVMIENDSRDPDADNVDTASLIMDRDSLVFNSNNMSAGTNLTNTRQ